MNHYQIESRPPIEPLPIKERIEIAKNRGDDILIAIIEENYGAAAIREMWVPDVVKEIRELEAKAKNDDEEARKTLRIMLLLYMPDEVVGSGGVIQGSVEASELHR